MRFSALGYTPCPNKKGDTKLAAVTRSTLNRFLKVFFIWQIL